MDNRIKHEGGQADCPRNAENARQRVLMVHNFYQIGGGEHTVFTNEVAMLRRHGHEVVEYTRKNDELKSSKLKLLLSPLTTLWSWKSYREVKRLIRSERIDVVHCHNTFPLISPSVYYAAKKCKVPVFQTIHNFRILCPAGVFFRDGRICEACRENGSFKQAMRCRCYRDSKLQTLVVVAMLKLHRALGTYRKINYRAPLKIYSCPYAPIFHSNFLPKLLVIRQYDFVILTIICYKISAPLNNPIFLEVP